MVRERKHTLVIIWTFSAVCEGAKGIFALLLARKMRASFFMGKIKSGIRKPDEDIFSIYDATFGRAVTDNLATRCQNHGGFVSISFSIAFIGDFFSLTGLNGPQNKRL